MPSQTIRAFRPQSSFSLRLAALLAVLLLSAAAGAALGHAAPAPQKDGQDAARKVFEEGERLRRQATPDSLRGAVEKYQEALRLWRAARDSPDETAALVSLGVTFQLLQQHDRAVEVYEQALALLRESGERPEEGDILYNLGTAQLYLGRFDRAVETYERALAIERRAGDRAAEGNTLAYLGAAYERMGAVRRGDR
jgi:tetratricopeptide (TPR) repeat protein